MTASSESKFTTLSPSTDGLSWGNQEDPQS